MAKATKRRAKSIKKGTSRSRKRATRARASARMGGVSFAPIVAAIDDMTDRLTKFAPRTIEETVRKDAALRFLEGFKHSTEILCRSEDEELTLSPFHPTFSLC